MIALKLVFQSLAGVGSVAAVAGGGYYAYNLPNDFFLLVTASANTTNPVTKDLFLKTVEAPATKPSALLSTAAEAPQVPAKAQTNTNEDSSSTNQSEDNKKYECKSIGTTKGSTSSCDIYSLTFDTAKKTLLSTEIHSQIKDQNTLKKVSAKAELVEKKFFLLKTSSSLYKDWKFDGSKTINLASTEEKDKSFATLTVHAIFDLEYKEGTTNFAIAKATETIPATSVSTPEVTTTYKCQLANKEKSACELSKFSKPSLTELSFASIIIPSTTTTTKLTFEANKYYLIKWTSDTKYSFKDLEAQTVVLVEETTGTDSSQKTFNFTLEAPVIVLPATATTDVEQVLIIK